MNRHSRKIILRAFVLSAVALGCTGANAAVVIYQGDPEDQGKPAHRVVLEEPLKKPITIVPGPQECVPGAIYFIPGQKGASEPIMCK